MSIALALGIWLPAVSPATQPPDVLLVVWDTTRASSLTPYGYARDTTPHLAELAAEGVVFERAESAAPWTVPSVASLLTGLFTHSHGTGHAAKAPSLKLRDDVVTLAEVFSGAGYVTAMFTQNTVHGPRDGFEQGFDQFQQGRTVDLVANGVRVFREAEEAPVFAVLYWIDPHAPYEPAPEFDLWSSGTGINLSSSAHEGRPPSWVTHGEVNSGERALGGDELSELQALYDGELRQNDAQLGTLLGALDTLSRGRDRVTLFTSDHGESFGEHADASVWHSMPYQAVLHVPMVLHAPGALKPARVEDRVRTVDIYPTLLELAGVGFGHEINGRGLVKLAKGRADAPRPNGGAMHFSGAVEFFHGERYKLIERRVGAPQTQLYDLLEDPNELRNLADKMPRLVEAVRAKREAWVEETTISLQADSNAMTSEEEARLRALGYIE